MRYLKAIAIGACIAFIGLANVMGIDSAPICFTSAFAGPDYSLVFPSPSIPTGQLVYRDLMHAIEVISVTCDGQTVVPSKVTPPGGNRPVLVVHTGGHLLYSCWRGEFFVCPRLADNDPIEVVQYSLPRHPTKVIVEYRFRTPQGVVGEIYRVQSVLGAFFPAENTEPQAEPTRKGQDAGIAPSATKR